MSFPRYPKYKASGVEWLGEVPEHWNTLRIKRLFEIKKRIAGVLGFDVLSVTQQGLKVRDLDSNDGQISMDYSKYQFVEIGDFAMNHMDLLTGYIDIASMQGVTSPDYRVFSIRDQKTQCKEYFLYLFQMGYKNRIFFAYGQGSSQLGRWRLPTEQFNDFPFPLPPLDEQVAIAGFLDRETAKIDGLVAEQRKLIDLLKEKRQAVISHAVTCGLNPSAPMKPSGIEWLGDIPAHWEVTSLKRSFESIDYGISDALDSDGQIAVLRMGNIIDGKIVLDDLKFTDSVDPALLLRAGDLLYNRTNSLHLVGKVGMYSGEENTSVSFASYLVRLRTTSRNFPPYFSYLLNVEGLLGVARADAFIAIGQCNLNPTRYGLIRIALPPLAEQIAIVEFLDAETAKIDALVAESERAIELLQERRTALISAAVTGKIDVRNHQDKETA